MSAKIDIESRVIMSADIVGSTALYEAVGDTRANKSSPTASKP